MSRDFHYDTEWYQTLLDPEALRRILNGTGIPLCCSVSEEKLLLQLNEIAFRAIHYQLRQDADLREVTQARIALTKYRSHAGDLSFSNCPIMLPPQPWYDQALERLTKYIEELSDPNRQRKRKNDVLRHDVIPNLLGIFQAAFAMEPVSTKPVVGARRPQEKSQSSGATVMFVRLAMSEVYAAIERSMPGDTQVQQRVSVFNVKMKENSAISEWILEVLKREPSTAFSTDQLDIAQLPIQDHTDWSTLAAHYELTLRKSCDIQSK